jgi:hypothetical protein
LIFLHASRLTTHNLLDIYFYVKDEVKMMNKKILEGWPFESLDGMTPDGGGDGGGPCPG